MSLITEYNLSFSDIENCTAPRKPRSIKPQQYVQASDYEREILTKLPQIGAAKPTIEQGDIESGNPTGSLGIQGVGKLHSDSPECIKYTKTERRKRKRKKRQRNGPKFREDCYDNDNDIYQRFGPSLLPSIQSKPFTCEKRANQSMDKSAGKTMTELADYFRCYQGNYDNINTSHPLAGRPGNDREKLTKNYTKTNADVLLSQVIEKDKNDQRQATKQLEKSILRGKGMGHTSCTHH
jgi:hypothetical protein